MAAFPRTVKPATVTYPQNIGSLISIGQSGAVQTRSQNAQGLIWQETWPALPAGNEDVQELLVTIQNLYNTGATCTLTHYLLPGSGLAKGGAGGGTPVVNAAGQSGTTLNTDGWTNNTGVLKAGDCFTIAGLSVLFRTTADVTSHASGGTTAITITPPIVAGSSPADEAALTIDSATITAIVLDYSGASAGPAEYIGGLTVTFQEAP
jgi:hypothetical protein